MSQVTALDCGISCCGNSQATQTNLSLVLRIAGVALGILALGGSALLFHFRYDLRLVVACAAVGAMTTALSIFMRQIPLSEGQASHQVDSKGRKEPIQKSFEVNDINAMWVPVAYPLANGNLLTLEIQSTNDAHINLYDSQGKQLDSKQMGVMRGVVRKENHIYFAPDQGGILDITVHDEDYTVKPLVEMFGKECKEKVTAIHAPSDELVIVGFDDGTLLVQDGISHQTEYQLSPGFNVLGANRGKIFYTEPNEQNKIFVIDGPSRREILFDGELKQLLVLYDRVVILQKPRWGNHSQLLICKFDQWNEAFKKLDIEEENPQHSRLLRAGSKIIFVGERRVAILDKEGNCLKKNFAEMIEPISEKARILENVFIQEQELEDLVQYLVTQHKKSLGGSVFSVWNLDTFELESRAEIKDVELYAGAREGYVVKRCNETLSVYRFDPKNILNEGQVK